MNIHIARNPFFSKEGQFEKGKQSLCIGLDIRALQSTKTYRCYIGKNKKIYYEIDTAEALRFASENTIWTNKKGKRVAILPLSIFSKKKSKWDKKKYEEKEHNRAVKNAETIQGRLI